MLAFGGTAEAAAPAIDSFVSVPPSARPGETVTLTLEAHDPDCAGVCTSGCGTYIRADLLSWSDDSGRAVSPFSNEAKDPSASPFSASVDWTAPAVEGTYTIEAYVADSGNFICGGRGETRANLAITVTAGSPPVIDSLTASPPRLMTDQSSQLVCSASDPEGSAITYSWAASSGTLVVGTSGTSTFTATEPGIAQVTCTATDGDGLKASRTVNIASTDAVPERMIGDSLINPSSVAIDPSGNVYVVDPPSDQIIVLNLGTGNEIYRFDSPGASSIAVDWSGNLLIGHGNRASVFSPAGTPLGVLTSGGFGDVADVAVDSIRRRYGVLHASGRVTIYEANGVEHASFGSTGTAPEQFESPGGLGFTPTGQIVVADSGHGLIKVFSSDGSSLIKSFGGLGGGVGEFVRLHDVSVRNDGVIFASDTYQSWIQSFNPDGSPREVLGTYGDGLGQLKTPAGLTASDDFGRLVVTSINSSSLQVLVMDPTPAALPLPAANLSTSSVGFPAQPVGTSSNPVSVTLRNSGSSSLGLHDVSLQGVFEQQNDCGSFLRAGSSCTFRISFRPTSPGLHSGALVVETSSSIETVALSGEGFIAPGIALDPWQLQFPDQWVGSTSDPRYVTISNTGTLPLTLQGISVSGPYETTHSCPSSLGAGASCQAAITFSPLSVADSIPGRLDVYSDTPGSPHSTILDGRGTAIDLSSSPEVIDFGTVELGQPASRPVVLTNTGTLAVQIESLYLSGTDAGAYEISRDLCSGRRLFLGEQCELTVRFPATQLGSADAEIQIPSNTTLAQDVVLLHANGVSTATGLLIAPRGVTTSETGATDTFTVVLEGQPMANVVVIVSSDSPDEGLLSDDDESNRASVELLFDGSNWNVPQTVTVHGVDDAEADGNAPYWITTSTTSADTGWDGLSGRTVAATNRDDDAPGVTLSPILGLTTSEAGGTAGFTVVLNAAPSADVELDLSISDATEGSVAIEGSPAGASATVKFGPADWYAPRALRVFGEDDLEPDGDQGYVLVSSATRSIDPAWNGLTVDDLALTNIDDEPASFVLENAGSLVTTEDGKADSFTIALAREPVGEVTFTLSTGDATEGTVAPASMRFDAATWDTPQHVTVTGVDDAVDDGDQPWIVITSDAVSTDPTFSGAAVPDPVVTNRDDDLRGVSISPLSGLVTSETGGTAQFLVTLGSEPSSEVTIELSSSDPDEGIASPSTITFTPANWSTVQAVTVTGVDDAIVDGDQPYAIVTSATVSTDPAYSGLVVPDVELTNLDDDAPTDDSDGDGIDDDEENDGPNGGDGDGDGIPDSSQRHVASFRAANGNGFITLISSCDLSEVAALVEDGFPAARALFPFGLVEFELPCSTASVTLLYHAGSQWANGTTYLKYGPDSPGQSLTTKWYSLPGTVFDVANVAGKDVARARFTLTDGKLGDDTGVDGVIVDQGGPAIPGIESIPTASEWMLLLLAALLATAGWFTAGGRMTP